MIPTNFRTYTSAEVIESFFDKIKPSNMPALIEYLQNPEKAGEIQAFKELNGELFFLVNSLWAKYGRPFSTPSDVLSVTEEDLKELDQEEILKILEYASGRVNSMKMIEYYIAHVPALRINKLYKSKRKWVFNRRGYKISNNRTTEKFQEPITVIRPVSPYKNAMLADLRKDREKWVDLKEKLSTNLKQAD